MKTALFSTIIIAFFSFSANAMAINVHYDMPVFNSTGSIKADVGDTAGTSSLAGWLTLYYDLKNALVSGDAVSAANKAGALLKAINGTDPKTLPAAEQKALTALQPKLSYDARHISEVQDIHHQREHFANLSLNMYALAKATRLSTQPIYKDYCPMKKTYWLSSESAIKNPYFGSQMLTCGQVKETL